MKKIVTFTLLVLFVVSMSFNCFAANDVKTKTLSFNSDGTFRIMLMSDFQDKETPNAKSIAFLNAALDKYKPDLVIMDGDQITGRVKLGLTARATLMYQLSPINRRGIPFLFTFGNHDHDSTELLSTEGQGKIYRSYEYCFADDNGCDAGTYNQIVYSSDGETPIFNIYMMDSNNNADGKYDTVHSNQVQWYKDKSAELKALNGGNPLPSMLFQHIPVKEIYGVLKEVSSDTPDCVGYFYGSSENNYKYYVLDEDKLLSGHTHYMGLGESPCSESFLVSSGEYEAWLECGDIKLGAFFGHDHNNDFISVDDNGIQLGYIGGFGYNTYGDGDNRCVKIIDMKEDDVENYTVKTVRYCDIFNEGDEYNNSIIFQTVINYVFNRIDTVINKILSK